MIRYGTVRYGMTGARAYAGVVRYRARPFPEARREDAPDHRRHRRRPDHGRDAAPGASSQGLLLGNPELLRNRSVRVSWMARGVASAGGRGEGEGEGGWYNEAEFVV